MDSKSKDKVAKDSWVILIAHFWWQIWKERNSRIFEEEYTTKKVVYILSKYKSYENILHNEALERWDPFFKNMFNIK